MRHKGQVFAIVLSQQYTLANKWIRDRDQDLRTNTSEDFAAERPTLILYTFWDPPRIMNFCTTAIIITKKDNRRFAQGFEKTVKQPEEVKLEKNYIFSGS